MLWAVPLSTTELIPRSLTATLTCTGIRSFADVSNLVGPISHPEPSLRHTHATLHLNAFRGEPAITEFDWPFTPNHRSSPRFSTLVGSVLHDLLQPLQPAHG